MKTTIPPPLVGLIAAALIWVLSRYVPQFAVDFPGRTIVAGVVLASGILIDLIAVGAFRSAKTTVNPLRPEKAKELVVKGLYTFTRNPMYLGMLVVLIGWGIWCGNVLAIIPILAFVTYITVFQIKPEEAALTKVFGDDYQAYLKRVRRWL